MKYRKKTSREPRLTTLTTGPNGDGGPLPQTLDNSTGLVLSGGGARGAYQIGCWKAFLDWNLNFGAVAGSSIGALNGALVCQGNWDTAYELWLELTRVKVLEFDFRRLVKSAAVGVQDRGLLLTLAPKVRLMKAFEYSSSMLRFASRYVSLRGLSRHGLISIEKFRPLLKRFIDMRNISATAHVVVRHGVRYAATC